MAYQALYRKWRPRTFADVIGQNSITGTLINSIKLNKISHAFLFAGPRGTGKTSVAKILAKTVNCLNIKDGEPCNECVNCLAADASSMNDLIEIDAASNNGVDEIRDIRDKVKYAPTEGKYKVYIIDEVHMLSIGAFNALLKTLEEPPEHVIFILATTELQKVPATIISRTQKYTFKRIGNHEIVSRLAYILGQEQVEFEDKALQVIAKVADGGMRDALSILDQIISFEKGAVTYADALSITGYATEEKIEELFLLLLEKKTSEALILSKNLQDDGSNPQNVLTELIELSTRGLIAKKANQETDSFLTTDFLARITQSNDSLMLQLIEFANQAINELRFTNQQNVPLDVFCVRVTSDNMMQAEAAAEPTALSELQILNEKIAALNSEVQELKRGFKSDVTTTSKQTVKRQTTASAANIATKYRSGVYQVLETATKEDLNQVKDVWPDLISTLEVSKRAMMKVSEPVAAGPNSCVVAFDYQLWFERATSDTELLDQLSNSLASLMKKDTEIVLVPKNEWPNLRTDYLTAHRAELANNKNFSDSNKESEKHLAEGETTDSEAENSTENSANNENKNAIIEQARQLFGDEIIDIKD